jgi:hypothetical protein
MRRPGRRERNWNLENVEETTVLELGRMHLAAFGKGISLRTGAK